jgi:hypothetical protein
VVWYDDTPRNYEIFYKKSTDGGTTWTSQRLTYSSGESKYPDIAVDTNNHIHVVWDDDSPGNFEIHHKKSTDGGMSWTTKRLTFNSGPSRVPRIAVDSNDNVNLTWHDYSPGNDEVYYKRSTDGGTNWTTKRLTFNSGSSAPTSVAADSNNHIHVVWHDETPGNAEVFYKKSADGGINWTTKRLTFNPSSSYIPTIATDSNNHIHVTWFNYVQGSDEIYYKKSTDGGASWSSKRLTYNSGYSRMPAIATDSSNYIHVTWHDSTPGNDEIFYKRSTDGGTSWSKRRLTWNAGFSHVPTVAAGSNNHLHLVWQDDTFGNIELLYRKGIQ